MSRVAALFDLDHTLLDTSSGQLYARYLYRHGKMGRGELARVREFLVGEERRLQHTPRPAEPCAEARRLAAVASERREMEQRAAGLLRNA